MIVPVGAGLELVAGIMLDQENFHQRVLRELLERSSLARELSLWTVAEPSVTLEPLGGLFDLALLDEAGEARMYLELKANSWLGGHQFERQAVSAEGSGARRAYVLLGPTFWAWHRVGGVQVIGVPQLVDAMRRAEPSIEDDGLRQLARAYLAALDAQRDRWERPLPSATDAWDDHEWLRFYDGIIDAWSEPAAMYPVTNPGGRDLILNPERGWREVDLLGAEGASVYWELVFGSLRFKVHWPGPSEQRREARDACQQALFEAARESGIGLERPRARVGTNMSVAEMAGGVRERVLVDDAVDASAARTLYEEVMTLHEAAVGRLGR